MASEYIDREAAKKALYAGFAFHDYAGDTAAAILDEIPSADVVTRDCFDRILWENDIMREQLADIGKKFGEKMDNVAPVTFCRDCKNRGWVQEPCHGKSIDYCHILERPVDAKFFCAAGERRSSDD